MATARHVDQAADQATSRQVAFKPVGVKNYPGVKLLDGVDLGDTREVSWDAAARTGRVVDVREARGRRRDTLTDGDITSARLAHPERNAGRSGAGGGC